MSNAEILSAAYHEAGHFVFASNEIETPTCIEMEFNPSLSRWVGKTPAPLTGSLSVEDQFATIFGYCFSGCFAQVKHAIGLLDSDAAIPWNQVLNWMLAAAGEPLRLSLPNGQSLMAPAWWFDEADADAFKYSANVAQFYLPDFESYGEYLHRAFTMAVSLMEDDRAWSKIERLAIKLASSIRQQRARLEADEIPPW
ncbi:MAG: hypothetical protein JNL18_06235 [Planctomycetaceae bacterium]|nr:hypothetical protein [Planctomycetaceae bacterium]